MTVPSVLPSPVMSSDIISCSSCIRSDGRGHFYICPLFPISEGQTQKGCDTVKPLVSPLVMLVNTRWAQKNSSFPPQNSTSPLQPSDVKRNNYQSQNFILHATVISAATRVILFSKASSPALRPTQPPIQSVPGTLSTAQNGQCMRLTTSSSSLCQC